MLLAISLWRPGEACAQWTQPATDGSTNYPNGNVGIGTASPGASLDIGGNPQNAIRTSYFNISASNSGAPDRPFIRGTNSHLVINGYGTNTGGTLYLNYPGDLAAGQAASTRIQESLFISPTGSGGGGNVGIGTANPGTLLNLAAPSAGPQMRFGVDAGSSLIQFWKDSTVTRAAGIGLQKPGGALSEDLVFSTYTNATGEWSARLTVRNGGNVGIGTTAPSAKLEVNQGGGVAIRAFSGSAAAGQWTGIQVGRTSADGTFGVATQTGEFSTNSAAGDVILRTESASARLILNSGTGNSALVVSNGNVGVGKANPAVRLDVEGGINATGAITGGTIEAKYQDVAEWVPSVQKLSAGTVVVLDADRTNHVLASSSTYDTKVAGVVSGQPGVILGVAGEGKLMVATTGRVKVRVDATRAPVRVGDLLVTSGVEGVAMKSVPVDLGGTPIHRPGTIIGKALEPLEKGVNDILVLLSLQ
ncbi:MAG TPA: hypothetical protein VFF65_13055 [Phycisphaerales bacterium]|nr:hypothetical protein [Phycisphaerales bacterium]